MGYQPRSTDKRSCGVCRREHSQDLGVYDVSAFRRVESKDFRLQGLGQVYNCLYEPTLRQTFSSGGLGILRPSTQAANTGPKPQDAQGLEKQTLSWMGTPRRILDGGVGGHAEPTAPSEVPSRLPSGARASGGFFGAWCTCNILLESISKLELHLSKHNSKAERHPMTGCSPELPLKTDLCSDS